MKIDVSGINLNLEIKRLDQELFTVTPDNAKVKIPKLRKEYGRFFDSYSENIIAIGSPSDSLYPTYLNSFLSDSMRVLSRSDRAASGAAASGRGPRWRCGRGS